MQFVLLKLGDRDVSQERCIDAINLLDRGKTWTVYIQESKRTDSQNRYLWGCVYPAIQTHLEGWDKDDIHEWCLGECFGWETLEGFGRKRIRPMRRSSKLSKKDFAEYVGWIQRTMAEKGIVIPDPE